MLKRLLLALSFVLTVAVTFAQEDEALVLVNYESEAFGVQHLVPDGWRSAGVGVFLRGQGLLDATTLVMQSAPLNREQLVEALLPQLGRESLPDEVTRQIETEFFTWDAYVFDVDAGTMTLTVGVAFAEAGDYTHLVLIQAKQEEGAAIIETVFYPVIESLAPFSPAEIAVDYVVEEVTFTNGDVTLAGTFTKPVGEGVFPAIVLVSGSGAQDRDESLVPITTLKPFYELANFLTLEGYAVLRYDDRGAGESTGDFQAATLSDFASDASAAIDYLLTREDVQADKIGLLGHSEGGLIAPEVATNSPVAFIVMLAGPAVGFAEVLPAQNELLLVAEGMDVATAQAQRDAVATWIQAFLSGDTEAANAAFIALVTLQMGSEPDAGTLAQLSAEYDRPYWTTAWTYEPADYWVNLDIPVLAFYGGKDVQVPATQSIPVLEELLAGDDVTVITIENANHLFQAAETGALSEYGTLEPVLIPELYEALGTWLSEKVGQ